MAEWMKKRKKKEQYEDDIPPRTPLQMVWFGFKLVVKFALGIIGTIALVLLGTGIVFGVLFANYLQDDVLSQANYSLDGVSLNQTSYVYYEDKDTGEWRKLQRLYSTENRIWANSNEIPEMLGNAAIAIEDKRFYEHQGVDWKRTISASLNLFMGSGDSYGGSSITQQLIKNLTQDDDITVRRKILEIFRALEFEQTYTKEEILEWYLNTIYLGQGCYGVKSAANVYFAKDLNELTLAECACLVGITNNPSLYDPYINPENNRERQLIILYEMYDQGLITEAEYEEAKNQEMVFKNGSAEDIFICPACGVETREFDLTTEEVPYTEEQLATMTAEAEASAIAIAEAEAGGELPEDFVPEVSVPTSYTLYFCPNCNGSIDPESGEESEGDYSYFVDTVFRDVVEDLMEVTGYDEATCETMVKTGGYTIYCTLDMEVQDAIDAVYEDIVNVPTTTSAQQLQSAIVVIDNSTGDIVGLSGGVGEKEGSLTLNRATQSKRSPGSSVKPLSVYAPAMEYGVCTPASIYEDSPYENNWPKNQSNTYSGPTTVTSAVARSLNTVSVKVLADLGVENSFNFMTEKLGFTTLVESTTIDGAVFSDIALAPLSMGAFTDGVTVREMTQAFATFPNDGIFREARTYTMVLDADGNVILDNTQDSWIAMKDTTAWNMTLMLMNAVNSGTGTPARLSGMNVAGKTGTTSDDNDRYFAGYTPYYTAAVWCGFDIQETIRLTGNGTNPSIVMWRRVMTQLHNGLENQPFFDTSKLTYVTLCSKSGLRATEACINDVDGSCAMTQMMFADDVPSASCTGHTMIDWCHGGEGRPNEFCSQMPDNEVGQVGVWNGGHNETCTAHNAQTVEEATRPPEPETPEGGEGGETGEGGGTGEGAGTGETPPAE